MIRPVVKDVMFLAQKSEPAKPEDKHIMIDLLDTLQANADACVGMAANMIGIKKRIIVVNAGVCNIAMANPEIISCDSPYDTEEGCLSLEGVRPTKRYENIELKYLDMNFEERIQKFSGWVAQIIQHEIDHCNGIII